MTRPMRQYSDFDGEDGEDGAWKIEQCVLIDGDSQLQVRGRQYLCPLNSRNTFCTVWLTYRHATCLIQAETHDEMIEVSCTWR